MIALIHGANNYSAEKSLHKLLAQQTKKLKLESAEHIFADEVADAGELDFLSGGMSLFTQERLIVLHNLLSDGGKALQTQILETLEKGNNAHLHLIIYENQKADKRTKLYKFLKKNYQVDEFPEATQKEKTKFIKTKVTELQLNADRSVIQELNNRLQYFDLRQIEHELLKLQFATEGQRQLNSDDLQLLTQSQDDEVWELFVQAVDNKREAYLHLHELLKNMHYSMIIGFLASQLRQLIHYYYFPEKLHPFVKKKMGRLRQKVDTTKLHKLIGKLTELDLKLKTSEIEPELGLTMFLMLI